MARPLLFPVAFATLLFVSPANAEDAPPPPDPAADPPPPPEPVVPEATRAAGNVRLPLYDEGCMRTKSPDATACRR